MSRHATPRLRAYAVSGVVGLAAALALGQPEPALFVVPLLVLAVAGLASARSLNVEVEVLEAPTSLVEGQERHVLLLVRVDEPIENLYLDLDLADGLVVEAVEGATIVDRSRLLVSVRDELALDLTVVAEGWGRRSLGPISIYYDSAFGMLEMRQKFSQTIRIVSVPADALVSELLIPRETNLHAGDLVSRSRGIGSEFSEMRPYQLGDDPRSLNWRVSSRTGSWWVNDRYPERNGDVVLVVDAQVQPDTGLEVLVDRSVRLAGALLREYGRKRYRLGLVTADGMTRFIQPGSGEQHRRRIIEQLLGVQGGDSTPIAVERAVLRVAVRPALVIMLTPMLDDSLAGLAHSLRVSGIDVAMIEVDPSEFLPEPTNEPREIGRRVWKMERDRLRDLLVADGIALAPWRRADPPDVVLSQLASWRSSWRLPV